MKNIKIFEEFDNFNTQEENLITIPCSVIENWIQSIEAQEDELNQKIYAKEEMQKFLDDIK